MKRTDSFKRKVVATAIAASFAGMSTYTLAADAPAEDKDMEVIVVSGIVGSLTKAADIKRDAKGITDAITAEDMGKFPDTNLAESLQRITGVSIDRENGEGKGVTVRGLGPRFNLVQLNGRQLASASGTRSFDFSTISSDMIRGVDVYKTSDAARETGGMGATMNVTTLRPLNEPGERTIVTAKGINDMSADETKVTPEFAAIYSNTSDDGKFGVAVAVNVQERHTGRNEAKEEVFWLTNEWGQGARMWLDAQPAVDNANQVNKPVDGELFALGRMGAFNAINQDHERLNGQIVLQYRPMDNLTVTADYNYFKKDIVSVMNSASIWYDWDMASSTAVWSDGPVKAPLVYGEIGGTSGAGGEVTFAVEENNTSNQLQAYGLNFEYGVTEDLKLELDMNASKSEITPNGGDMGSRARVEMASLTRRAVGVDYTGEIPAIYLNDPTVDVADIAPLNHWIENKYEEAEVSQVKFKGTWLLAEEHSLDFGLQNTVVTYDSGEIRVERGRGHYEQYKGQFADFGGYEEFNFMERYDAEYGDFETIAAQLPNGTTLYHPWTGESHTLTSDSLYHSALTFDMRDMYGYISDNFESYVDGKDTARSALGSCGTVFCASNKYLQGDRQGVEETTSVAFVQWDWESEVFDMIFDMHVGYRYEKTEVESQSAIQKYDGVKWVKYNEVELVNAVDSAGNAILELGKSDGSYEVGLPSFNFNIELTDDIVARFAYSKSIARAQYGQLKGGVRMQLKQNPYIGNGESGNPGLEPLESTNYDYSLEYYYGEGSYVSAAYFRKDISNFVGGSEPVPVAVEGLYQPGLGQYAAEASAALGGTSQLQDIFAWIMDNKAGSPGVEVTGPGTGTVYGDASRDPTMQFDISKPFNGDFENGVDGYEVALQHMFGETGFGLIANYTVVNSDEEYDNRSLDGSNALVGVSDSANFIAFYENDDMSIRLAYNWRDKFLVTHNQSFGAQEPQYRGAFQTLDLNASYNITEEAQIFFQGINILNEKKKTFGREDNLLLNYTETGARFMLGGRYEF